MIELVKLHHVSFTVKDLEASKHFYRDVLGLAELPRPNLQARGAWLAVGDRQIHLIEGSYRRKESENVLIRSDHVALEVKDLEGVRKQLRGAGLEFHEGENFELGIGQIFCQDPDGHVIEFVHNYNE